MQHGAVETRRLERVVAALLDERAADKGDPGQTEEQPQFAQRIGEIDVAAGGDCGAGAAARNGEAPAAQQRFDRRAAHRVARRDDGQEAGMAGRDPRMRRGDDFLFARMGARGEPHRTAADFTAQRGKRLGVGDERRGRRFEIADARHRIGAEPAKALGLHIVLRQRQGE